MSARGKGIFVTGTDTGVGKTYVARGLARTLTRDGIDVGVMKPAETGCRRRSGRLTPADAIRLRKATGAPDSLDLVNPYRFSRPLAPSVAAELAGRYIDPARIISSFLRISKRHDFTIVEGAGGIMVPLSANYLYLDLAKSLSLPVLIVSRPGLGTINHTLLTISALQKRRLRIAGVVMNFSKDWKNGLAEKTSMSVIEEISGERVLGIVRYGSDDFDEIVDVL